MNVRLSKRSKQKTKKPRKVRICVHINRCTKYTTEQIQIIFPLILISPDNQNTSPLKKRIMGGNRTFLYQTTTGGAKKTLSKSSHRNRNTVSRQVRTSSRPTIQTSPFQQCSRRAYKWRQAGKDRLLTTRAWRTLINRLVDHWPLTTVSAAMTPHHTTHRRPADAASCRMTSRRRDVTTELACPVSALPQFPADDAAHLPPPAAS